MSVRAYIVKKIETDGCLFNLWHDTPLVHYLVDNGYLEGLNGDMAGLADIPIEGLAEFLGTEEAKELDEDVKEYIKKVVAEYKDRGEDYIMVYCY